jgi:hypothetical protein
MRWKGRRLEKLPKVSYNTGFKLCPDDVNLIPFLLFISILVLGGCEVLLIGHNLNP